MINDLLCLFFINGSIAMCNLKKRLICAAFWVLLQAMFMSDWKQTAKRWKLYFWDDYQSITKYNSVEHLKRQQFSGVCCFQRWTREKKIAQSFLPAAKIITKYSSESFFLSIPREISTNLILGQISVSNLDTNVHRLDCTRLHEITYKYNNYSGLPYFEMQLLQAIK